MTVATMLDALACGAASCVCAVTVRNGSGRVHCPVHKDDRPSLNVSDRDGTTLVHCHAGCAQDAVIAALRDRKLWNGMGPASAPTRSIEATYAYTDEHGAPLFEVIRYRPKGFVQRRPDGHGGWLYQLNGTRRVLFNLPEVRAVAEAGWQIVLVEGEKDAAALIALGLCATTSPHGAGKWRDEYAGSLRGAEVVVIADKDEPGRAHAQSVARSCFGKAKSVKVLELPGETVKDTSDWISSGGTRAELETLAAAAPEWAPPPNRASAIPPASNSGHSAASTLVEVAGDELARGSTEVALPYLPFCGVDGYVIEGWSHLIAAYPRTGKTELIVRQVRDWIALGHDVLYLTEEARPMWEFRLRHLVGDWSKLRVVFGLGANPASLLARAFGGSEDIVTLDAARNLLQLQDENDNSELARITNPWVAKARETQKTLVVVHHMRKGSGEHGEGIAGGHAILGYLISPSNYSATRTTSAGARSVRTAA